MNYPSEVSPLSWVIPVMVSYPSESNPNESELSQWKSVIPVKASYPSYVIYPSMDIPIKVSYPNEGELSKWGRVTTV